jgi:signal recognition particle GTPase
VKLGKKVDVPVFELGNQVNPVEIARQGVAKAKEEGYDVVIVDTAGRLQIDESLMTELKDIKATVHPTDTLLVVDAMTGQEAASLVKSFNDQVRFEHAPVIMCYHPHSIQWLLALGDHLLGLSLVQSKCGGCFCG